MTSTEATNLKTALTKLSTLFAASVNFLAYITRWKNDVDAESNGSLNSGESATGIVPGILPVCTVANLPGSPATNDEAIVTDATGTAANIALTGGSNKRVLVRYNGSAWQVIGLS